MSWACNNCSALVGVPVAGGKARSTRVVYRTPDPGRNPYLALSVILTAGLKGIGDGYELPAETVVVNVFELTDEELAADRLRALPQPLHVALREMGQSELVAESLGEHIFEWSCGNKRPGWCRYGLRGTPFEIEQCLRTL